MTNFDALKQIYEALGGDKAISGTNLDALKAIAEVAGSGGGGGGGLVVHETESSDVYTLDKTWKEIHDVYSAGGSVVIERNEDGAVVLASVVYCVSASGNYIVETLYMYDGMSDRTYYASSETDYPSIN